MLSVAPAPTIFLHTDATDMQKSFTGLRGLVRSVFNDDPADGSLFLFVNKRRDRIKTLWWDGDGFVLWYKRLEQGTFEVVASHCGRPATHSKTQGRGSCQAVFYPQILLRTP